MGSFQDDQSAIGPVEAERLASVDRDGDGIPDASDACPMEPGAIDPSASKSGCPRAARVIMSDSAIRILQMVNFDANGDVLKPVSFPILDQMYANQPVLNDMNKLQVVGATAGNLSGLEAANAWAAGMGLPEFLKQRGIGDAQIRQCMTQAALETFSKQVEEGRDKGVDGTPTFFINDVKVPEVFTWDRLEVALRSAGAR